MIEAAIKYISVFLLSMVKFIGGPVAGAAMGLSFWATAALTIGGMMTSVLLFTIIGTAVSNYYAAKRREKGKPVFNKKSRRIVKVWQRFGIAGIAFLTPVIFSPIIGTIFAIVLGAKRNQIMLHMLWSAVFWGISFTFLLLQLKHLNLPFIHR